jgi:hypothetical protein
MQVSAIRLAASHNVRFSAGGATDPKAQEYIDLLKKSKPQGQAGLGDFQREDKPNGDVVLTEVSMGAGRLVVLHRDGSVSDARGPVVSYPLPPDAKKLGPGSIPAYFLTSP